MPSPGERAFRHGTSFDTAAPGARGGRSCRWPTPFLGAAPDARERLDHRRGQWCFPSGFANVAHYAFAWRTRLPARNELRYSRFRTPSEKGAIAMRLKIIIVNAGIVAIVAVLSFVLLSAALKGVISDPSARKAEVERAIRAANAQLELDGLLLERWLAEQAARHDVREVFTGGTERARSDSASGQADKIRDLAMSKYARLAPSMVLFVDAQGVALGRNGSALMRGDKMADRKST